MHLARVQFYQGFETDLPAVSPNDLLGFRFLGVFRYSKFHFVFIRQTCKPACFSINVETNSGVVYYEIDIYCLGLLIRQQASSKNKSYYQLLFPGFPRCILSRSMAEKPSLRSDRREHKILEPSWNSNRIKRGNDSTGLMQGAPEWGTKRGSYTVQPNVYSTHTEKELASSGARRFIRLEILRCGIYC